MVNTEDISVTVKVQFLNAVRVKGQGCLPLGFLCKLGYFDHLLQGGSANPDCLCVKD